VLSHARIWAAIDQLAGRHSLTASGLARRAGLDPTTFNPSKRIAPDGRPRWPSTESIAKVLQATGERLEEFLDLLRARPDLPPGGQPFRNVPLLGFAQAGTGGFFDDGGFPAGQGWDEVAFPGPTGEATYALEVAGDSMLPLYRDGDIVIVSPTAACRKGDRVVVRTRDGEVMAKILEKKNSRSVELRSLNPDHKNRMFPVGEIDWMARIIWASQ
jgi:phage repressor protein C with HTH and peptisase S24 domain